MTDNPAAGPEPDLMGGPEPDEERTDVMGGRQPGDDVIRPPGPDRKPAGEPADADRE